LLHQIQIAHVGLSKRIGLKLFGREVIQPMWSWYLNVTDGQTYVQTRHAIS